MFVAPKNTTALAPAEETITITWNPPGQSYPKKNVDPATQGW